MSYWKLIFTWWNVFLLCELKFTNPGRLIYDVRRRTAERRSVLGPILFLLYVTDLLKLNKRHQLVPHAYANDIQFYGFCLADRVSACIDEVSSWMRSNWLQANPSKTEVLWCSFQSTSAPDPDLACAYRQHLCTTGHFRSWSRALHRLWRQLTDTRHRHRQIVLRCLTADTQCSAVSPTARPAVAHPCVTPGFQVHVSVPISRFRCKSSLRKKSAVA